MGLSGAALTDFLALALRGYTVRRLRELMAEKGHDLTHVPDAELIRILTDNAPQLQADREELDANTLRKFGLANKLERVRRLCEAGEKIEGLIDSHPKWMAEYRQVLNSIKTELEPLGIEISWQDSWAQLLSRLVDLAEGEADGALDEGDLGTEEIPAILPEREALPAPVGDFEERRED